MTSPQPCPVTWCARSHLDPRSRSHSLDLGTFDAGRVTANLVLLQIEVDGVLAPAVIRVFVDSTDHRRLDERADISTHGAAVLSDALADLPLNQVGEFIAALGRGQILLGERDEPVDYYAQRFMVMPRLGSQIEADATTPHDEETDR
ncbi:hypothetical protein ABZU32_20330 [Sphaerisporangium sp. NPDC005288]|uniref:hypothetical protein n=1 Tax=Sphaerisporangium sp. NPDC005288 TaxID=3155114 RepID=UPI0033A6CDC3